VESLDKGYNETRPTGPVAVGDRVLLRPELTGAQAPAWAEVEIAEWTGHPDEEPWNSGPGYPWRVGYRIDIVSCAIGVDEQRGIVWLNPAGEDLAGNVLAVDAQARRPNSKETL
jgi:hypothetical protein